MTRMREAAQDFKPQIESTSFPEMDMINMFPSDSDYIVPGDMTPAIGQERRRRATSAQLRLWSG